MSLRSVTRPGNVVQRSSLWPRTQRLGTRRALAPPPNLSLPGNYRVTCHCIKSRDTASHRIPSHTIAYHRIPSHPIAYHRIPSHTIRSHVTAASHATSHTIAYHRIPSHTIASHRIPSGHMSLRSVTRHRVPSHTIAYHRIPSHPTFIHPSSHSNQSCNSFSPFFILTIFNLRDIHDNNHHTGERSSAQ
jgi:hypothetical protein